MNSSSARSHARIAGGVYLAYFLTAVASGLLLKGIVVAGDAEATATNILAHAALLQCGSAVSLISTALYLVLAALFYELFKPVNNTISLLAALFALVGCTLQAVGSLLQLTPLLILRDGPLLGVFTLDQLQALALLSFKLHLQLSGIELVFFGFYDLLLGYLIVRSLFLPRVLGLLMALAGLGWLTFLAPRLAGRLSPSIQVVGFLAEVALMVWLIVKGVDAERWAEQDEAA